jgi:hypothetical protein
MKIQSNSTPVQTPPRTTKAASGTGKPKAEAAPRQDATAMAKEAAARTAKDPVAQQMKKVQSVNVTG